MNKNEKNSIRKYDSIARNYDETFEGRFTARYKQKILEICEVPNGGRVLDVGCGNGSLINAILHKGNVEASAPHSVWNNLSGTTIMIGLSVKKGTQT